jgi:hypothetical protein
VVINAASQVTATLSNATPGGLPLGSGAQRHRRRQPRTVAPTAERKEQATRILGEQRAHTVAFFGRHTIEHIVPPNSV